MKFRDCVCVLILVLLSAGLLAPAAAWGKEKGSKSSKAVAPSSSSDDSPVPPKDAQWTIYCRSLAGPDHVPQAKQFKAMLQQGTKLKGWYVIHGEAESTLYFGYYRTINDPDDKKETKRAKEDLRAIRGLRDEMGDSLFPNSLFVEVDTPDPGGPPEWNLANAPADAYWSLQVGAYKDSPDRKRAAVEAVKEARAQGHEAYYYHGQVVSSVCIGAWPREAIKEQEAASAQTEDPETAIYVLPRPLPQGASPNIRDEEGRPVKIMAPRIEPQDPSLLAMMRKFPTHLINGLEVRRKHKDPQTGKTEEWVEPSLLVVIPGRNQAEGDGLAQQSPEDIVRQRLPGAVDEPQQEQRQEARQVPARRTASPGAGKLRSIGD